jgi:hypothetical protein
MHLDILTHLGVPNNSVPNWKLHLAVDEEMRLIIRLGSLGNQIAGKFAKCEIGSN